MKIANQEVSMGVGLFRRTVRDSVRSKGYEAKETRNRGSWWALKLSMYSIHPVGGGFLVEMWKNPSLLPSGVSNSPITELRVSADEKGARTAVRAILAYERRSLK